MQSCSKRVDIYVLPKINLDTAKNKLSNVSKISGGHRWQSQGAWRQQPQQQHVLQRSVHFQKSMPGESGTTFPEFHSSASSSASRLASNLASSSDCCVRRSATKSSPFILGRRSQASGYEAASVVCVATGFLGCMTTLSVTITAFLRD